MNRRIIWVMTLLYFSVVGSTNTFAGGYALYEWNARGISLGGATIANVKDASTLASNPAGITQIERMNGVSGLSAITLKTDLKTVNDYDTNQTFNNSNDDGFIFVPNAYFSSPVTDKLYLGIGVYSRFGMSVDWGKEWPGRYNVFEAEMRCISISPSLAYKVLPNLSVALGVEIMQVDLELKSTIDATQLFVVTGQTAALEAMGLPTTIKDPTTSYMDVDQNTTGDSLAFGYNLSLHYTFSEKTALGFSYISRIKHDAEGEIDFSPSDTVQTFLSALRQSVPGLYEKTNFTSTVTTPDMIFLGVMVTPVDKLSLELSANWVHWSVFEELKFKYDTAAVGLNEVTTEKDWHDAWRLALGLEYGLNDQLCLRSGFVFDQTPIEGRHLDYLVPDSDRNMLSCGLGYTINDNIQLDFGYLYIMFKDRSIQSRQVTNGVLASSFDNTACHIYAANIGYQF